jgi:hypothetical protein
MGQSRRPLNPTTGTYMIGTVAPFVTLGDGGGRAADGGRAGLSRLRGGRPHRSGRTRAGWRPVRRRYRSDPARLPVLFRRLRHGSGAGIPVARRDPERCSIRGAQLRHAVGRGAAGLGDGNLGLVLFADAGYVGTDAAFQDGDWHAGAGSGCAMTRPSARSASISRPRCAAAASVRTSSSISVSGRPSDAPPDPFALPASPPGPAGSPRRTTIAVA